MLESGAAHVLVISKNGCRFINQKKENVEDMIPTFSYQSLYQLGLPLRHSLNLSEKG